MCSFLHVFIYIYIDRRARGLSGVTVLLEVWSLSRDT